MRDLLIQMLNSIGAPSSTKNPHLIIALAVMGLIATFIGIRVFLTDREGQKFGGMKTVYKLIAINVLLLCIIVNLTACTSTSKTQEKPSNQSNLTFQKSDAAITVGETDVGDFQLREIAPVTKDGKTVALLTLNQIQKLGIYDWTSAEAVDSGIKSSYTCNFKVKYLQELANGKILTFYIKPKLVNSNGKVVGKPCIVGWSGFPETAVFDNKTREVYTEYGVQPLKKSLEKTKLVLDISDSAGNQYDSIQYVSSIFKNAVKGPSLHTSNKPVTVTGASKAKYKISIYDIYLEKCFTKNYQFTDIEDSYEDNIETAPTLMFNYKVDYVSGPKTKLEVSNIHVDKETTTFSTDLKIGAQSNVDNFVYYDRNVNLMRFVYSNSAMIERSASKRRAKIHTGTYAYYTENRQVSQTFYDSTTTIRFRVELSSDALAMSPEKLMKFNGRFIVFELRPETRQLYKKKTKKRPYIAYTSDKNYE